MKKIQPRKRGRPSLFTRKLANKICSRLASGESLRRICETEGMPTETCVRTWALQDVGKSTNYEGFFLQYTRAREVAYLSMGDEIKDISDTPVMGEKKKLLADGGVETTIRDMTEHRRIQIDTRKWLLSKMLPKVFGDRLDLNVQSTVKKEIDPATVTDDVAESIHETLIKES